MKKAAIGTLFAFVSFFSLASAQPVYLGLSTGSPLFNDDFKAGAHLGVVLSPSLELRVSGEGNLRNFRPEMASFDLYTPIYLQTDRLATERVIGQDEFTQTNIYLGGGLDGYYGPRARNIGGAYRFGVHGVAGVETFVGRVGLFGEVQPGVVSRPDFSDVRGSFRGRIGFNFHL